MEELLELAESVPAGADSLLFLPYLEGERAPLWDARASGAFIGLRTRHTEAHLVRAILEGVAFGLRQILDLVDREAGRAEGAMVISGGAARVRLWNQIKADIFGRTVATPANPHAGVLGAAMLAAVAARCFENCDDAARAMASRAEYFAPSPEVAARYQPLFEIYSDLYPALRSVFTRLHEDGGRQPLQSQKTYV
jgi:xylulokinase